MLHDVFEDFGVAGLASEAVLGRVVAEDAYEVFHNVHIIHNLSVKIKF